MQDLVRQPVADSVEHAWIGERALQRVRLGLQPLAERRQIGLQHIESARIVRSESGFSIHHMQRRAVFRAGLGEEQRAGRKVE